MAISYKGYKYTNLPSISKLLFSMVEPVCFPLNWMGGFLFPNILTTLSNWCFNLHFCDEWYMLTTFYFLISHLGFPEYCIFSVSTVESKLHGCWYLFVSTFFFLIIVRSLSNQSFKKKKPASDFYSNA